MGLRDMQVTLSEVKVTPAGFEQTLSYELPDGRTRREIFGGFDEEGCRRATRERLKDLGKAL
jgi:hypothetical protein